MEYLLLVTWFLAESATSSYQVPFASRQACEVALSDLRNDARRLRSRQDTMRTPSVPGASADPSVSDDGPAVFVSAICVSQR